MNRLNITIRNILKEMFHEENRPEGASYKLDLDRISDNSSEINDKINPNDDLPGWVQDKITLANHNMEAVLNYLESQEMKSLYENWEKPMNIKEGANVSKELQYHLDNNITLGNCEFRYGSDKYFDLVKEVKNLYNKGLIELNENDSFIAEEESAKKVKLNGEIVYLDCIYEEVEPINEAEYQGKKVQLNKPKRGGSKKFYVYVKNPKTGKVKKVSFGAKSGGGSLAVKLKDPKAKKAFKDRHDCENKNDKTKAGYWSCRLPRYAKSLGLSGGGTWW